MKDVSLGMLQNSFGFSCLTMNTVIKVNIVSYFTYYNLLINSNSKAPMWLTFILLLHLGAVDTYLGILNLFLSFNHFKVVGKTHCVAPTHLIHPFRSVSQRIDGKLLLRFIPVFLKYPIQIFFILGLLLLRQQISQLSRVELNSNWVKALY